ncbi:hypothetical protein ACVBEQ_23700 [Nakamurella sp. GG22]
MLRRAELSGDTVLARAIVGRAFEAGWIDVMQAYVDTHPADAATIDELIERNAAEAQAEAPAANCSHALRSRHHGPRN